MGTGSLDKIYSGILFLSLSFRSLRLVSANAERPRFSLPVTFLVRNARRTSRHEKPTISLDVSVVTNSSFDHPMFSFFVPRVLSFDVAVGQLFVVQAFLIVLFGIRCPASRRYASRFVVRLSCPYGVGHILFE